MSEFISQVWPVLLINGVLNMAKINKLSQDELMKIRLTDSPNYQQAPYAIQFAIECLVME